MKITENREEPKVIQHLLEGITIELSREEVEYIKKCARLLTYDEHLNVHWIINSSSTVYVLIDAIMKVKL